MLPLLDFFPKILAFSSQSWDLGFFSKDLGFFLGFFSEAIICVFLYKIGHKTQNLSKNLNFKLLGYRIIFYLLSFVNQTTASQTFHSYGLNSLVTRRHNARHNSRTISTSNLLARTVTIIRATIKTLCNIN